jgi:hypothetical protein
MWTIWIIAYVTGMSSLALIPPQRFGSGSSSRDPVYVHGSYALHANAYIAKPGDFERIRCGHPAIPPVHQSGAYRLPPRRQEAGRTTRAERP